MPLWCPLLRGVRCWVVSNDVVVSVAAVMPNAAVVFAAAVSEAAVVAAVVPATILGIAIWRRAYSGFVFLAANQDAFNIFNII